MRHKRCQVPQCTNTSKNNPNKLFVSIPKNPKRRKKWLQLARTDPKGISMLSNVFMCEDHFQLERDIKNYTQYKMGLSDKILLTDEAVPTKFNCQEDRRSRMFDSEFSRPAFLKRQRTEIVSECLQNLSETVMETHTVWLPLNDMPPEPENEHEELPKTQSKETFPDPVITKDKSTQVSLKSKHFRSKAVQTTYQNKCICTSPMR